MRLTVEQVDGDEIHAACETASDVLHDCAPVFVFGLLGFALLTANLLACG